MIKQLGQSSGMLLSTSQTCLSGSWQRSACHHADTAQDRGWIPSEYCGRSGYDHLLTAFQQSLLIWWDAPFILDLCFDIFNWVAGLYFKRDHFSTICFHANTKQDGGWILFGCCSHSVCTAIFQLFTGENQSLLVGWDTLFVLDFCLDIFDRVAWFDFKCDCLACEGLDENLHSFS